MTYDKLTVALLSMLSSTEQGSTNAQLARFMLEHAGNLGDVSVRRLADAAHVGVGSVSRFARDAGFADFAALRDAIADYARRRKGAPAPDGGLGPTRLAEGVGRAVLQAERTIDRDALGRLVGDLRDFEKVSAFGLLKGQAAALGLQVDLLTLGRWVNTCASPTGQAAHIAGASSDELIVIFSRTAAYFEYVSLGEAMRRAGGPRVWLVCGVRTAPPPFVFDRLLFEVDPSLAGHPHQLVHVASLIAQEYAGRATAS